MSARHVKVREIYSLSFKAYQEYRQKHDMRMFNRRIQDIAATYKNIFCQNHLLALAIQVQDEHDEWMRMQQGVSDCLKEAEDESYTGGR